MNISQKGLELITSFEGYHQALPNGDCTTYYCPAGVLTIGFGVTEGIKPGEVWTRQYAMERFRAELKQHEAAVNQAITVSMSQGTYDALTSFSYNLGIGAMRASTIVKLVNAGKLQEAAKYFAPYNKARDPRTKRLVVLPGLVRRRAAEAALFLEPDEIAPAPQMPQKVEAVAIAETHQEAHALLKEESTSYGAVASVLKALGLPVQGANGAAGLAAVGGLSAWAPTLDFVKTYGFKVAIGVGLVVAVLEIHQVMQREKKLS